MMAALLDVKITDLVNSVINHCTIVYASTPSMLANTDILTKCIICGQPVCRRLTIATLTWPIYSGFALCNVHWGVLTLANM